MQTQVKLFTAVCAHDIISWYIPHIRLELLLAYAFVVHTGTMVYFDNMKFGDLGSEIFLVVKIKAGIF